MFRLIQFLTVLYFTVGQEFPANICDLPKDVGTCRKYVTKYFYNSSENACKTFGYGGCGGNANNFDDLDECESSCRNATSPKKLRTAIQSDAVPQEVFIGTVLDVNQVETEIINFESGFGNWSTQSSKILNLSDTSANSDGIKEKEGEHVLVPTVSLGGGGDSELSKSFDIASDSLLEVDFSLYISGYNSTLVGVEKNPSFGVLLEDESTGEKAPVLDLDRLPVSESVWKKFRFEIKNEDQRKLKIIFSMSLGIGSGNVIALDDVEIRWIPMLETEANTIHKNILFSNVSTAISTQANDTISNESNNGVENSTEINTTTTSSTTEGLFGELTVETINKTVSESTNKTVIETPGLTANETSTNISTYNTTESSIESNKTGSNETTEKPVATNYTDNPNIFGPFNQTAAPTNESAANESETSQNKTETTTPENNNQTENSSQSSMSTNVTNAVVPQNETMTTAKNPEAVTANVNVNETTTEETETPKTNLTIETTNLPTTANNVSNTSAIKADDPDGTSTKYGYTAEVVLICLVVIFGLLFLFMVVKYYRLRTSIGDYQIQQGARQTYDNPAFNGFGMQDSYRSR